MTWTAEMKALEKIGELGMNLGCSYDIRFGRVAKTTTKAEKKGNKRMTIQNFSERWIETRRLSFRVSPRSN